MDTIEQKLRQIIRSELAVDPDDIDSDTSLADIGVDTDDLSFLFIPEIERTFDLKFTVKEWRQLDTINQITEFIKKRLDTS